MAIRSLSIQRVRPTQSTSHVTEVNELVKLCPRGSILSPPIPPLFSLISMQ
jgi:hypothetical protein